MSDVHWPWRWGQPGSRRRTCSIRPLCGGGCQRSRNSSARSLPERPSPRHPGTRYPPPRPGARAGSARRVLSRTASNASHQVHCRGNPTPEVFHCSPTPPPKLLGRPLSPDAPLQAPPPRGERAEATLPPVKPPARDPSVTLLPPGGAGRGWCARGPERFARRPPPQRPRPLSRAPPTSGVDGRPLLPAGGGKRRPPPAGAHLENHASLAVARPRHRVPGNLPAGQAGSAPHAA